MAMSTLKKLAGQTAIYGLSSIVARFLNYLLTPVHTAAFSPDQFGIITEMYAYVSFLVVLLTYGMETTFFRFSNREGAKPEAIFGSILRSLLVTSAGFALLALFFRQSIANLLHYPNHAEYVAWFALIIALDAVSTIPMARLRQQQRSWWFVGVNFSNVGINVALNLFFLAYCKPLVEGGGNNWLTDTFYNPEIGVGYVFIANLIASAFKLLLLLPQFYGLNSRSNEVALRPMLAYALPLLLAGMAGMVNETLDRILLKYLLLGKMGLEATMTHVGIYGACYKISIIITLFIQAFRYAADPFFFSQAQNQDAPRTYALIMRYFVITCLTMFLTIVLFIDFFKYFIPNEAYWEGLRIVPILLLANIALGIYYNQSVWYKMTDRTFYGARIAVVGAFVTVLLNLFLIPFMGYMGSAWATLGAYTAMVLLSWYWGRKVYPIPYPVKTLTGYTVFALTLFAAGHYLRILIPEFTWIISAALLLTFGVVLLVLERKYLPVKVDKNAS
jgi:O-antigen/teichoic acid export membrane protein